MAIASANQRVATGRGPGRVTVGVQGALEGSAVGALRKAVWAAMQPGMDLIVDLSEVTAIGPDGLAALTAIRALAEADGSLLVRAPLSGIDIGAALDAISLTPYDRARLDHPAGRAD